MKYYNVKDISVSADMPMRNAIEIIDRSGMRIALVVSETGHLEGIVTDGDVRRAFLAGHALDTKVSQFMQSKPRTALYGTSKSSLLDRLRHEQILHLPLVDDENFLHDIAYLPFFEKIDYHENQAVIMAGGLGTRLRPLTETIPKPMVNVGGRPIIDGIVESLVSQGFKNITICVNYLGHIIEEHLKDGSRFGANIDYIKEEKRMGTAGALSLIKNKPEKPFFVMNGDIVTNIDLQSMLDFHTQMNSDATMAANVFTHEIPYGVIEVEKNIIKNINEKPKINYLVNAGIYVLDSKVIDLIPKDTFFDMTSLFDSIMEKGFLASAFPVREEWLDVGRPEDLQKANENSK